MGQLVTYLLRRDKDPAKFEEQSALFDFYRAAYEDPSHAHAREDATVKAVPAGKLQ